MAIFFQTKGRPAAIREIQYNDEYMYCFDFEEESKSAPPKDLPKPDKISSTAIINTKQFSKLEKNILANNDRLDSLHQVFIKGEIINGLSSDLFPSHVTYIGFEVQYIPRKEGQEFDGNNILLSLLGGKGERYQKKLKSDYNYLSPELVQLHKYYDGVCQSCGQRCDKRLVRIPDNEETIVCIDCYCRDPKPIFFVNDSFLQLFSKFTGFTEEKSKEYLTTFPKTYAFVDHNRERKSRVYWSWDEDSVVKHLVTTLDGRVKKIVLRNGDKISSDNPSNSIQKPTRNSRKSKIMYIAVNNIRFQQVGLERILLSQIIILADFKKKKPNRQKVEERIKYYQYHQKFDQPVIVVQKEDRYLLLDGYTRYIAAEELNLSQIDTIIVKKLEKKGSLKDGVKN